MDGEDYSGRRTPHNGSLPWARRVLASKVTHNMLALPLERYYGTQYRGHRTTKNNLYRAWKMVEAAHTTKVSVFQSTQKDAIPSKVRHTGYRETLSAYREGLLPVRVGISQNETLPEEVKDSICGGFGLTEDDWYNLSFVRPFHSAAMKLLYKKVNCHRDNLVSLTRTLLEREDLASLVQTLDIEDGGKRWSPEEEDYSVMYAHVKGKGLTTSTESEWIDAMDMFSGNIEAILMTLLVLSIPQVRHLSVPNNIFLEVPKAPYRSGQDSSSMWTLAFPTQHANKFNKGPGGFDQLSKVHISGAGTSVSELAPLFKLPALLTLVACGFEEAENRAKWNWNPNIFSMAHDSSIKVLELYGGMIHSDALKTMLVTCTSLEAFAFDYCQLERSHRDAEDNVNFASIKEALEPFSHTLKSLSLDETRVSFNVDQWQPLGSLKHFTKLEYVRLDLEALYASDSDQWKPLSRILPSCIKGINLVISSWYEWPDPLAYFRLENFVQDLVIDPTVLPNLKLITTSEMLPKTVRQLATRGIEVRTYYPGQYGMEHGESWEGKQWETRPRMSELMGLT